MKNTKRIPADYERYSEDVMSNCFHTIDTDIAEAIKDKKYFSGYAGWNFHGNVWWEDNSWHCEIKCYRCYQETMSAKTLQEIMDKVSEKYGYD